MVNLFVLCQTAGHELLGEMSLAELKERLALLKEAQQTEQQEKQEKILEVRQNKKQLLLEQMDTIDLHRRALAQAAAIRSGYCLALISLRQWENVSRGRPTYKHTTITQA